MKAEIRNYIVENLEIDDDDIIEDLLVSYRQAMDENMVKLENAIAAGDTATGGAVSHTIKGASANIGAQPIFEVAKECEFTFKAGQLEEGKELFAKLTTLMNELYAEL